MSWLTIAAITLFAIGLAALTIAAVENWQAVEKVGHRWGWIGMAILAAAFVPQLVDQVQHGRYGAAALSAAISVMLSVNAYGAWSRRRGAPASDQP